MFRFDPGKDWRVPSYERDAKVIGPVCDDCGDRFVPWRGDETICSWCQQDRDKEDDDV